MFRRFVRSIHALPIITHVRLAPGIATARRTFVTPGFETFRHRPYTVDTLAWLGILRAVAVTRQTIVVMVAVATFSVQTVFAR